MAKRSDEFERELTQNLKRAATALARGVADQLERSAERAREHKDEQGLTWAERAERKRTARLEARAAEQRRRLETRRQQRELKLGRTHPVQGYAFIAALGILVAWVLTQPNPQQLWWLIFPALFLLNRAIEILAFHAEQRGGGARKLADNVPPLPSAVSVDPRQARLEATCDRLLEAVRASPESVRAFLGKPEQTVESLRATSRALLKREQDLRKITSPDEVTRLTRERATLEARIAAEPDEIARARFTSALELLDRQREERLEIARYAGRLEAEHLRLGYTLEGLHTQLLRLRSVEAPTLDEGLRHSLDALRDEVGALAEALESVNAAPLRRDDTVSPADDFSGGRGASSKDRTRE